MNATNSTPAVKTERKARKKAARTLKLLETPAPMFDGYGALRITEGKKADLYLFRAIEADFGEGYEVEKLTPELDTAEVYHVSLARQESSCTCKGNTYCGHCRHVEALTALDKAGKLPRLHQKMDACNGCQAHVEAPGLCERCQAAEGTDGGHAQAEEMQAADIDPWDCPEADHRYEPTEADPLDW